MLPVAKYKKCPGCGIDLKPQAPLCYVCSTPQPGFEQATEADLAQFDARLAAKDALEDKPKGMLIGIMLGWIVVLAFIVVIFLFNQSLFGPGGTK